MCESCLRFTDASQSSKRFQKRLSKALQSPVNANQHRPDVRRFEARICCCSAKNHAAAHAESQQFKSISLRCLLTPAQFDGDDQYQPKRFGNSSNEVRGCLLTRMATGPGRRRRDGMEVPSGTCDPLGGIPMKKSLLLGVALAALALGRARASAELKFKPGEDAAFNWANLRRPQEGRPQGRDADHLRAVARRGRGAGAQRCSTISPKRPASTSNTPRPKTTSSRSSSTRRPAARPTSPSCRSRA